MTTGNGPRHFHGELAQLRSLLLEMSSLAEELLRVSMEALLERDAAKAHAVILGDRELDAMEVEVDERCIQLLALQQPLARDLRLITMAMKISNDLERVGDHAVNIAEAVARLGAAPLFAQPPESA
jgi:phosphate transport system protein